MLYRSTVGFVLLVGTIQCALGQVSGVADTAPGSAVEVTETGKTFTVAAGTRILLSLKSEISTRSAMPGDPVYLVSDFPVVQDGAVVLPAGMYVRGVVDRVQRAGKVKGRAQLLMHFTSVILPNGVEVPLPGSLDRAPGSSKTKVKDAEGTVEQAGGKGQDTQRIASDTLQGTAVGGLVGYGTGSAGMGAGIGAGAGAAVGVLTTLFTRGNDVVFQQGTTMEMVLSRPLVLEETQLRGMPASSGMIVRGSAAAQPLPALAPKQNK